MPWLLCVPRQLRSGCEDRPAGFPQRIVLCGVPDLRDYRIHSDETGELVSGSCIQHQHRVVAAGGLRHSGNRGLARPAHGGDRTVDRDCGHRPHLYADRGQPWLPSALRHGACFGNPQGQDRSRAITEHDILAALLTQGRVVHLDQFADTLREDRVQHVVEPQLLLQAFLRRVLNGSGRIEREYGFGRQPLDLLLLWSPPPGLQRIVIECKVQRAAWNRRSSRACRRRRATWICAERTRAI